MSSVTVGHVVGTVSLLMMFFAVGAYYQNFFGVLTQQGYTAQLTQVSSYLASAMVDLVTLAQTTPGDQFLVKEVNIPFSIGEKIYNVSLSTMPSSRVDVNVVRLISSIPKLNEYSIIDLPWSSTSPVHIYSTETVTGEYLLIANNIASDVAASQSTITHQSASIMVWCMKSGDEYTIGFGVVAQG